ncbi:MAG: aspartate carbamoyltransferase [Spirochaetaceae bacterium]|nr:aspartate carbamoyltransferase [Spirochaetaceae bacterium]MCF7948385.1 aspartate carbamoyltransferase [Spirochaetia bacterium]MCF7951279.1 aspartate carbamoyltransferase [Spirochaetaceae bacterium]
MSFKGRDILSSAELSKQDFLDIMKVTEKMETLVKEEKVSNLLSDKLVGVLFLEPSTRTRLSFEAAVQRLGAKAITVASAASSSAAKGESLADTAKTVDGYVDLIVVRQPEKGGAKVMADAAEAPVINGGDGAGQHPTQALLDLYTILKEKGTLENLKIAMVGDLKNGRTVHSLSYTMAPFSPKEYIYCAPDELQMPADIVGDMEKQSVPITKTNDINVALQADIVYMTRIQRERFENPADYERLKGSFVLDRTLVESGNKDMTIMHPLPRVDEISTDVDDLPNAAYFRQAQNGMYLRMALLAMLTGRAEA